jgi:TolB protein
MNADGSGVRQLSADPADDFFPAWSPDGAQIAFVRDGAGIPVELYLINVDGTGVTRLTDNPGEDIEPVFSPVS